MEAPIPLEAPVTTATLFFSFIEFVFIRFALLMCNRAFRLGRETAVDRQTCAGDECSLRTGQVSNHACDLISFGITLYGHKTFQGFCELSLLWVHVRCHRSRLNNIYRD